MKKLFNLILLVTTSLLFLSCEKEKYPGAYPYDNIVFKNLPEIYEKTVTEKDSISVVYNTLSGWNKELYPMELWVDNEEIATISSTGYLTGKKEGTVTIYAKVMSVQGEIEDSIRYTVKDYLKELIKQNHNHLRELGFDRNIDGNVTVSEVHEMEIISGNYFMESKLLTNIAPYMPKLKEVKVIADTAIKTLDLSPYPYKKIIIHDKTMSLPTLFPKNENYDQYKKFFLKEFTFNNSLEHLELHGLPGIRLLDLREYKNLKILTRPYYSFVSTNWLNLQVILPRNIEEVNLIKTQIIFNEVYYNLKKIKLRYHIEDKNSVTEINKKYVPNLRNLHMTTSTNHIDISSFQAEDLDSVYVTADTISISQSMYEDRYSSGKTIYAEHYIIK